MKRFASAVWHGELNTGKGVINTESGVLKDANYSFSTRFESGIGTNPEELVAAGHAACFTMALASFLGKAGFKPERLLTEATVNMELIQNDWTVTTIRLKTTAKVPGINAEKFNEIAEEAKARCPISRLFTAKLLLHAELLD